MSYKNGWSAEYGFGSRDMGTGSLWMGFVSSLPFFSSLDLGPVQMALARVFTTFRGCQVELDFPRDPDQPKDCLEWY